MTKEIWFRQDVTDAEWEAAAQEFEKRAREFDQRRIDNWAEDFNDFYSGKVSISLSAKARVARNKGIDSVMSLTDLSGKLLDARIVDGKYGAVWCIRNDDGSASWVNVSSAKTHDKQEKFYASKGVVVVDVEYHFADGSSGLYPLKDRGVVSITPAQLGWEQVSE
jgi:hypothetical protein